MPTPHQTIDRLGGAASLICAIHCAVVPVVVLLGALGVPVAGELALFDDGRFELGFSIAALVFVAVSVGLGWRGADRRPMLIGFGVGLALIGGSRLVPGPEWLAHLILVVGALTLAWTHRRSREAGRCCEEPPAAAPLLP